MQNDLPADVRRITEFALEILRLDEPSQWQLEAIIRRAVSYGYYLNAEQNEKAG